MENEIWKDVVGLEDCYMVSNIGRVKSKRKLCINGRHKADKLIKTFTCRWGYTCFTSCNNNIRKMKKVHRCVMEAFVGLSELSVDHINGVKSDNNLSNLQYVTQRENILRYWDKKKRGNTSKYVGVSKVKKTGKFKAEICRNKKRVYLGEFLTEDAAATAYKNYSDRIKGDSKFR